MYFCFLFSHLISMFVFFSFSHREECFMLPNIQQNLKLLFSIFQLQRFLKVFTFSKLVLWLHLSYTILRKGHPFLLSAMLLMGEI